MKLICDCGNENLKPLTGMSIGHPVRLDVTTWTLFQCEGCGKKMTTKKVVIAGKLTSDELLKVEEENFNYRIQ